MLTLGFSYTYYTLWEVGEPQKRYTSGATVNGVFAGSYYMEQKCTYLQNLSMDYNAAIEKIKERSGKYSIDLDLKGRSSFTRNCGNAGNDMPDYVFSFGQLAGQDIRIATDVWQLKTTTDIKDVDPMRSSYANEFMDYVNFHAQYCYRGKFEVINIAS